MPGTLSYFMNANSADLPRSTIVNFKFQFVNFEDFAFGHDLFFSCIYDFKKY